MTENEIGTILVGTAIEIHRHLGPGLLESVYEVVLEYELNQRGFAVKRRDRLDSICMILVAVGVRVESTSFPEAKWMYI